jgi:hypothetical protein
MVTGKVIVIASYDPSVSAQRPKINVVYLVSPAIGAGAFEIVGVHGAGFDSSKPQQAIVGANIDPFPVDSWWSILARRFPQRGQ